MKLAKSCTDFFQRSFTVTKSICLCIVYKTEWSRWKRWTYIIRYTLWRKYFPGQQRRLCSRHRKSETVMQLTNCPKPVDRLGTVGWSNFFGHCYISVIPSLCLNRQAHVVHTGVGWGRGQDYIVFCGLGPWKDRKQKTILFHGMAFLEPICASN